MKLAALAALFVLLLVPGGFAQGGGAARTAEVSPYTNIAPWALRVSVENLGASGYSAPSVATFELSGRR